MATLTSFAEKQAEKAQGLGAFQDFNLLGVKSKILDALKLIGRGLVFREYTLHDEVHIAKMLDSLEWLVPEPTREKMTPADWLLAVLGVYFHDLGMLVTDDEFEARQNSDFQQFCDQELFMGDTGTDYESKVVQLGDDQERFLYQEYVRFHHADRVADWIQGKVVPSRGIATAATEAVTEMLSGLPQSFRNDLALVCASHHQDDLYDTEKYRPSRPYGDSDPETANIQYACLLLRTADLLHITKDRTPSIMFRLINPRDPVSQREWAKQDAVDRVRSQRGRDAEGKFVDDAPRNTIEVFATYVDADAFFGLTSYLAYAESQLQQAAGWSDTTEDQFGLGYSFPWRFIDTSEIRAEGFSPRQLSFSLDQHKILDLLTGHTLYNDTSVVLREVIQNALDATRLQAHFKDTDPKQGEVVIDWSRDDRELVVRDNGTGMTAGVIEKNLLKAGSSRYQEEDFKKRHPEFSPISRFGIGVLSAFMIADAVQITTCSEEEEKVHQLTLRSVHGRYLVRLLDKQSDEITERLHPHGTEVRLALRKSAELPDVADALRRWIVVPRCSVKALIEGEDAVEIGYDLPKDALLALLGDLGLPICGDISMPEDREVMVLEDIRDHIRTAFAVRWSRFFRQWEFLKVRDLPSASSAKHLVGTCVEGIRVEENSPGFIDAGVVALSDARGLEAPKTNVARVGLEDTPERRTMLRGVYGAYVGHVRSECDALRNDRGQSLTWAAQEGETQLELLLEGDPYGNQPEVVRPVDPSALQQSIRAEPLVLIEREGERSLVAAEHLAGEDRLWTVDSGLVRAAERILREISADGSLHAIASGFSDDVFALPNGATLVGYAPYSHLYEQTLHDREVSEIVIRPEQRRVDLAWVQKTDNPRWLALGTGTDEQRGFFRVSSVRSVFVGRGEAPIQGGSDEVAIRVHRSFYLPGGTDFSAWILERADSISDRGDRSLFSSIIVETVDRFFSRTSKPDDMKRFVEGIGDGRVFRRLAILDHEVLGIDELAEILEQTPLRVFDTWAWNRTPTNSYSVFD